MDGIEGTRVIEGIDRFPAEPWRFGAGAAPSVCSDKTENEESDFST